MDAGSGIGLQVGFVASRLVVVCEVRGDQSVSETSSGDESTNGVYGQEGLIWHLYFIFFKIYFFNWRKIAL